jgi:hypothetical protein
VNTASDPNNCGRCGNRCATSSQCNNGACQAPPVGGDAAAGGSTPDGGA